MDTDMIQDELPFYAFSTPEISKSFNQIIFERESQELMKKLAGMQDYPESWYRQTPKGYEPHAKPSINSLLESQTTFEE
jgi:hypothetical protein